MRTQLLGFYHGVVWDPVVTLRTHWGLAIIAGLMIPVAVGYEGQRLLWLDLDGLYVSMLP
jgi:hypothetical protein